MSRGEGKPKVTVNTQIVGASPLGEMIFFNAFCIKIRLFIDI